MDMIGFVIACFLFSVSPGAGAIASINNVIVNGFKGGCYGVVGLQSALVMHLSLIYLGVGIMISTSPTIYIAIKYAGILYLIYMGAEKIIKNWRGANEGIASNMKKERVALMKDGFLINATNPKSIIFLTAFLPQFININYHLASQYITLGMIIITIDALVMCLYMTGAKYFTHQLNDNSKIRKINVIFGFLFIIIAITLLLS